MHYIRMQSACDTFSTHDRRIYRMLVLFLTWTFASFAFASYTLAQQPNPQDAFQEFFDKLANQSNTFMPGFLGELSEEQLKKLAEIEIAKSAEDTFGDRVLKGFLDHCKEKKIKVLQNGKEVSYLQSLCSAVKPLMKNAQRYTTFDLILVESEATDAYSIPGGRIVVTRGLLETVGTEAALVGVMAHELSHLDRGHQLLTLKQMKMLNQSFDVRNPVESMAIAFKPFRPEFETQADSDAVRWRMELQYEPKELARLLQSWDQRQEKQAPWMNFVPGFVKSHPDASKRSRRVLEQSNELRILWPNATYTGAKNLEQRIPANKRRFPR
ncbi:MAG: M48 family metallopeptidase [Pirellula sp.]